MRRSPRRKRFGLTVDRSGELFVHVPSAADIEEVKRWTASKLLWVHRKLSQKAELYQNDKEPEFVSGESFFYLGRSYQLSVVSNQDEPLRLEGDRFYLRKDALANAQAHFRDWYVATGKEWVDERVKMLAPRVGASPARVVLRDLGFRWGSCGKHGTVYLNWRLLQCPAPVVDYVVAHELAHLLEPHHGPAFWAVLDRAMPDWANRQEQLRQKARELYWCRPDMMF